jgi:AbiEi antitoxin C-terminal domain
MGGKPFDRVEARDIGLLRDDIIELLAAGMLRQPIRGVYLDAQVPDDLASRAACLKLRLPEGAAVCRLTAAWLLGVDALSPEQRVDPPLVECVVPRGRQPVRRPGVRSYAAAVSADVTELSGIPITTPRRTAIDVLRWLPPHVGLWVSDALAARRLVSREEVLVGLEEFAGCRGVARARYLADLIEPRSESFGESCLRLRIVDAGFPRPTAQIEVIDVTGHVVYRLDLGWENRKVAVEYDGEEFHSTPEQLAHDGRRRDALENDYGWRVLAVGRGEVFGRSLALERAIGELLSMAPTITRRRW